MPDPQIPKDEELEALDAMSTQELQQRLRQDALNAASGDSETLWRIMEILAERRKQENADKAVPAPVTEDLPISRASTPSKSLWKRYVAAAAALLVLVTIPSLMPMEATSRPAAPLQGPELLWSAEHQSFYFGTPGADTSYLLTPADKPYPHTLCAGLLEAMHQEGIYNVPLPTWLPEGYTEYEALTTPKVSDKFASAAYSSGEQYIMISVRDFSPGGYKCADYGMPEQYVSGGVTFYIYTNLEVTAAVWVIGPYQGTITGPVTREEMKKIIDSFEKG